jgi:MYXO-CTERM domain-containing protein
VAHFGLSAPAITAIHEAGLEAHAWTVDEPLVLKNLLQRGTEMIITNKPAELVAVRKEVCSALCPPGQPGTPGDIDEGGCAMSQDGSRSSIGGIALAGLIAAIIKRRRASAIRRR